MILIGNLGGKLWPLDAETGMWFTVIERDAWMREQREAIDKLFADAFNEAFQEMERK